MPPVTAIRQVIGLSETTAGAVLVHVSHGFDIDLDISGVKTYRDAFVS